MSVQVDPLPVASYEDHASVVLCERERAAAFCVTGRGHRWTSDGGGRYLCEDCDTPTTEGRA